MDDIPGGKKARVCAERCETCIFDKQNRFISTERFLQLREAWDKNGGHQTCHKFGVGEADDDPETGVLTHRLEGEDVWCRGFYETMVPAVLQIYAEKMGWVEFVPLPEKGVRER